MSLIRFTKWATVITLIVLTGGFFVSGQIGTEKRAVLEIGADGVQRVEVIGGSYYFSPNVIVVKVNVPVELRVRKEPGITPHNMILKAPEAGIDFSVSLSTTPQSITFTPTKTGKYAFECTRKLLFFKSHKDQGMHGILEVVD
jgi:plastocyanin domain-containing protein